MQRNQISIIVPTKNEEKNIVHFLRSVPNDIEVILVDASQDDTRATAHRTHHKVSCYVEPQLNIAQARQFGARRAKTPWLLFSDADVHFSENYFSNLEMLPNADAYYGRKQSSSDEYYIYDQVFSYGQGLSQFFGIPAASGSNMMIHRDAFQHVGGFDCTLTCNEDTEIFYRLQKKQKVIHFAHQLSVTSHDDRRLRTGASKKLLHTITRCTALYFNLLNEEQKKSDWGYWK